MIRIDRKIRSAYLDSLVLSGLLVLVFLFAGLNESRADEAILHFHSDITIERNGDLVVTETIKVRSEGISIRRGIYRDFPRLRLKANGGRMVVGFDVLSIKRNGKTEPWHQEENEGFTRIYIGEDHRYKTIPEGIHTYEITYRTDRQIQYFENHEELFWNVTGTNWKFPIEAASAKVSLPQGIPVQETNFYTGSFGSKEQDAISQIAEDRNSASFETTKLLEKRQGLSIAVKFPADKLTAPDLSRKFVWFYRDYKLELFLAGALTLLLVYYLRSWWNIGRDLPQGIIIPRWDISDQVSPAMINYIDRKGFGDNAWKAVIAAMLNLAVKGYVELKNLHNEPSIIRTDKKFIDGELPVGEAALLNELSENNEKTLKLSKKNGKELNDLHNKFKDAMVSEHRQEYYNINKGTIIWGVVFCFFCLFATTLIDQVARSMALITIALGGIWILIVYHLTIGLRNIQTNHDLTRKVEVVNQGVVAIFLAISALVFVSSYFTDWLQRPMVLIFILGMVTLNVMFYFLMGAPTPLGREKMDYIEGLRIYFELAEKDRLNLKDTPEMSPQHFENLLPYAVALGVEKPWTKFFSSWISKSADTNSGTSNYSPGWVLEQIHPSSLNFSLGEIGTKLEHSFVSVVPAPGSGSSGFSGGGFSGGGGGGGGW